MAWVCQGEVGMSRGMGTYSLPSDMGPGIPHGTVSKRAVRILVACFLVYLLIAQAGEINIKRFCVLSGWQLARFVPEHTDCEPHAVVSYPFLST